MMKGGKSKKQDDKLPRPSSPVLKNEEFGTFSVDNEAPHHIVSSIGDNGAGSINGDLNNVQQMLPAFSSVNMLGMIQSYTQGIPVADASKFNSSIIGDSLLSPALNFPFSQASVNEFGQYPILEELPVASNLENSVKHFHHLEKPSTGTMSVGLMDRFAGDIQMDSQDGEAIGGEICGSQLVGKFKGPGLRRAVLLPPPQVGAVHSKHPENLDGGYPKHGADSNFEARSESHFSSGGNPPVLPEENASLGQIAQRNTLNPSFNRAAGFSGLPNIADGSSSLLKNAGMYASLEQNVNEVSCLANNAGSIPHLSQSMGGWTFSHNYSGMPYGEGTGFGWNPLLTSHMQPTDVQYQYPSIPSSYARYSDAIHAEDFGDLPAVTFTPHSGVNYNEMSTVIGLPSSSLVMMSSASQLSPLQNCNMETFHNLPSEPLVFSPSVMGSNNRLRMSGHFGQPQALSLLQPPQKFPRITNTSGQAAPINYGNAPAQDSKVLVRPFLKRNISQSPLPSPQVQHELISFPTHSPFAHTPGLVSHHASCGFMPIPPQSPHINPAGISPQVQHRMINFPKPSSHLTNPSAVKTIPLSSPLAHNMPSPELVAQTAPIPSMPSLTRTSHIKYRGISPQDQHWGISFPNSSSHPTTPDAAKTVRVPSHSVHKGPSRSLVAQPPHASMLSPTQSPHTKWQGISPTVKQTMISSYGHLSTPDAVKTVPLSSPLARIGPFPALVAQPALPKSMPSPPQMLHIKQQDLGEATSPPIGMNCPLCKRDLSYAPEGPVIQTTKLPDVACLPCGHMFHDHCLMLITPADTAADPPCIPCALCES